MCLFLTRIALSYSQTKKEFWITNSDPIPKISVLNLASTYSLKFNSSEVRLIVEGSGGATDFGPYKTAYLIFDNTYEMPVGKFNN